MTTAPAPSPKATGETRFVMCDECAGTGEITVNDTPFHDDPYRVKEIQCTACKGTGTVEREVEAITATDLEDIRGD